MSRRRFAEGALVASSLISIIALTSAFSLNSRSLNSVGSINNVVLGSSFFFSENGARENPLSNFLSSIKYWDMDDAKEIPELERVRMKERILKELLLHQHSSADEACICSKVLTPFVCDTNGNLHSNLCRFQCSRSKSSGVEDIRPTMILTETSLEKSQEMCHRRFGKLKSAE